MNAKIWVVFLFLLSLLACASSDVQTGSSNDDTAPLFVIQKTNHYHPLLDAMTDRARNMGYRTLRMKMEFKGKSGVADEPSDCGSGFFISETGLFLTNYHVVKDSDKILLKTPQGRIIEATVRVEDIENDIALLSPVRATVVGHWLPLGAFTAKSVGQSVKVLGYPFPHVLNQPNMSSGVISDDKGMLGNTNGLRISAPIYMGNSGSPILNDKNEVLGIVNEKVLDASILSNMVPLPPDLSFGIKVNVAKPLILLSNENDPAPFMGNPISLTDALKATALVLVNTGDFVRGLPLPQEGRLVFVEAYAIADFDLLYYTVIQFRGIGKDKPLSEIIATGCIPGSRHMAPAKVVKTAFFEIHKLLGV